ncbi:hypothetical protein BJ165DRAFT_1518982 [Panaeolus papilionaceus]|nr:hypothetical protein BJ165DRAFT_1518982 [Panaeolus papilionaceus]
MSDYKNIKVTGPISLEKVTQKLPFFSSRIILLGITGTGKSNFLECLANDHSLGLSKNQLESVTQHIECYRLVNIKKITNIGYDAEIYLIDTPGFSDRKLSEKRIVTMLHEWAKASMDSMGLVVDRALYFERITDTRVSGSKKRAKRLFEMITGEKAARRVTIMTTMWDALWDDAQKEKAEKRFEEYRSSQWADFTSRGATCTKFYNSQESALEVLDHAFGTSIPGDSFIFESNLYTGQDMQKAPYASYLFEQLVRRIAALEGQLWAITEDMAQESMMANKELSCQLMKDKAEVELMLVDVHKEMEDFAVLSEVSTGFRQRISKWFSRKNGVSLSGDN